MDKISKNVFEYLLMFVGFEDFHKLRSVNKLFKKRINENKNYIAYKMHREESISSPINYEGMLWRNANLLENSGYEEIYLNYAPHFFHDIKFLKTTSHIDLTLTDSTTLKLFTLFKRILEVCYCSSNLKNISLNFMLLKDFEDFDKFAVILCQKLKLDSLEIAIDSNSGFLSSLLYIVKHCNTKSLTLKNLLIDLVTFYKIEEALIENNYIETLSFKLLNFTEGTSGNYFDSLIKNNNRIKNLNLIRSLNKTTTSINLFSLFSFKPQETNLKIVLESLEQNNSIQSLNIKNTLNLNLQVHCVVNLLSKNNYLKVINLSKSNLTSNQIKIITKGLSMNSSLTELNLSYNHIDSDGLSYILHAINFENSNLEKLILKDNLIDNKSDAHLALFISNEKISSLKYLDISCNKFLTKLFENWTTFHNFEVLKCSKLDVESYANLLTLLKNIPNNKYDTFKLKEFSVLFELKNYPECSKLNENFYKILQLNILNQLETFSMNFFIDQNVIKSLSLLNLKKLDLHDSIFYEESLTLKNDLIHDLLYYINASNSLTSLNLSNIQINEDLMFDFIKSITIPPKRIKSLLWNTTHNQGVSSKFLELLLYSELDEFSVHLSLDNFATEAEAIIKKYFLKEKEINFKNYAGFEKTLLIYRNLDIFYLNSISEYFKDKINIQVKYYKKDK